MTEHDDDGLGLIRGIISAAIIMAVCGIVLFILYSLT